MENETRHIVIVGGCGHVGLPLGIVFAEKANIKVTLLDIDENIVQQVNQGHIHFQEEMGEVFLKRVINKKLSATTDASVLKTASEIIFVTGTPVDEHLNPRIHDVVEVIEHYLPSIQEHSLVILRSTLFPGVSERIKKLFIQKEKNVFLSFCPERVAQGLAIKEIKSLPQIVSAFDAESEKKAVKLFSMISPEIIVLKPSEAELVKLFSNSWRYIEFAIANQHYMIAEKNGVNFHKVYQALTHSYPRAKHFAKAGFAAGPCLFKDTMQLSSFFNHHYFLGHSAMLVNEGLASFVVEQLELKLNGSLENKKIGLLGMAFKANNDDTRESLSYKVKKILKQKLALVLDTDVYQKDLYPLDFVLSECEGLILGAPHQEYKKIESKIKKPFIDCWGLWQEKFDFSQTQFSEDKEPKKTKNIKEKIPNKEMIA